MILSGQKKFRSPAYWSASDAYAGPSPNQSSSPEWNATSLESSVGEPVGDNGGNGGELVERFFVPMNLAENCIIYWNLLSHWVL